MAESEALHEARQIGTPKEKGKWLRDKKLVQLLHRDNIDVDLFIGKKQDLPPLTWRQKLLTLLHKPLSQLLLALLMVFDSALIIGEIVLEVRMFLSGLHARELQISRLVHWMLHYVPGLAAWDSTIGNSNSTFLANRTDAFIHFIDAVARNSSDSTVCAGENDLGVTKGKGLENYLAMDALEKRAERLEHEMSQYEAAVNAVAICSIVVLALFVMEVILKLLAMGPVAFFRSKLEVFDAAIILASFAVDVAAYCGDEPNPESSVLIILLIWRIVRLVNGFLMHEKQTAEAHNHIMQKVHCLMQLEVTYLKRINSHQRDKLAKYKELCLRQRVPQEETNRIEAEHPPVSIEEVLKQQELQEHELQQKRFPHNLTVFFGHHLHKPSVIFKKHSSALLTSHTHGHTHHANSLAQAEAPTEAEAETEADAEAEAAEQITFLNESEHEAQASVLLVQPPQ